MKTKLSQLLDTLEVPYHISSLEGYALYAEHSGLVLFRNTPSKHEIVLVVIVYTKQIFGKISDNKIANQC